MVETAIQTTTQGPDVPKSDPSDILQREPNSWRNLRRQLRKPNRQEAFTKLGFVLLGEKYHPEIDPRLLSRFQLKKGILAVRLGPLSDTSRFAYVLVYRPNEIEIVQQAIIKDKTDREAAKPWFEEHGYDLLPTSADRLVGYKNL
ncbi:hypothetical protein HY385_02095 [Candidatus Daviesbacteria bacterium]|nr:hypothetical protein [Candidatus Daviesbacteria bacterium]